MRSTRRGHPFPQIWDNDVAVTNSAVSRNGALNDGGGLYVNQGTQSTLTLMNTTDAANVAFDDGGAVHLADRFGIALPTDNTLTLLNSTITCNHAVDLRGGFYINGAIPTIPIVISILSGNGVDVGSVELQVINPFFEGDLADFAATVELLENSAIGTVVFDVDANDGSRGTTDNGITYAIIDGNDHHKNVAGLPFAIDGISGIIAVNDPDDLDFEAVQTFVLTVEAKNAPGSSTATATVDLTNVNETPVIIGLDATPTFTQGGSVVTLDLDVMVSDDENDAENGGAGNYNRATLTISRAGGADTDDVYRNCFGSAKKVSLVSKAFRFEGNTVAKLTERPRFRLPTPTARSRRPPPSMRSCRRSRTRTRDRSPDGCHPWPARLRA